MREPEGERARLMYAFAHDLRSCLRTMRTRVQLVQQTSGSHLAERENQWLDEAVAAGGEMDALIASMVTYESVAEVRETMPLNLLLLGLRLELKSLIAETGAEVTISDMDGDAEVSRCLVQVLRELVANSCRFRKPGMAPRILIGATRAGLRTIEAVVADNGTGVAEEYREAIFQPFRRAHARAEYPGFGLGLATCRRLVEANGGSISASASAAGGLCVRVLLPAVAGGAG